MTSKETKFRRTLWAAAGCAVLGGIGLYYYASKIEARRFKIDKLKVTTYGGGKGKRANRSDADDLADAIFDMSVPTPVPAHEHVGAPGSSMFGPPGGSASFGYSEAKPHLRVVESAEQRGSANDSDVIRAKILHISDVHFAAPDASITGKSEFLKRVTDDDYDLVVITGDIFENYSGLEYAPSLLSRKPRLGAFAVLGNHDYYPYTWFNKTFGRINRKFRHPSKYRDVQPLINALADSGIAVLRNSAVTFPAERLHLLGIDYPGTTPDRMNDLAKQAPDDFLKMALLHLPRRLQQLPDAGIHLAFAGHTHGGQVCLPGLGAMVTDSELPRHEASGIIHRGMTTIHVSRGIGADPKTNIRLFCPPAVTVLEVEHHP